LGGNALLFRFLHGETVSFFFCLTFGIRFSFCNTLFFSKPLGFEFGFGKALFFGFLSG